jgi:hypothetical protein
MKGFYFLLVPFKLGFFIISDDFKDISKGLTPTNEMKRMLEIIKL